MKGKHSNRKQGIVGLSDNAHLALMVAECGYFCQETWMALAKFLCNAEYKEVLGGAWVESVNKALSDLEALLRNRSVTGGWTLHSGSLQNLIDGVVAADKLHKITIRGTHESSPKHKKANKPVKS